MAISRRLLAMIVAVGALVVPAAALGAGAEQIVFTYTDEPSVWELVDPCIGVALHGVGTESGTVRITELGTQGHHVRVQAAGTVDLYDGADVLVGTWTYKTTFGDQFPPDAQGAVHGNAVGRMQYADGGSAIIQTMFHAVFDKGDTVKREFESSTCASLQTG
jgi:hypothetical protein